MAWWNERLYDRLTAFFFTTTCKLQLFLLLRYCILVTICNHTCNQGSCRKPINNALKICDWSQQRCCGYIPRWLYGSYVDCGRGKTLARDCGQNKSWGHPTPTPQAVNNEFYSIPFEKAGRDKSAITATSGSPSTAPSVPCFILPTRQPALDCYYAMCFLFGRSALATDQRTHGIHTCTGMLSGGDLITS